VSLCRVFLAQIFRGISLFTTKIYIMRAVVLIGRILFSMIFITSFTTHFSQKGIGYAAMHGVPLPQLLVPFAGIMAVVGGLSILLGFRARVGAWLIVAFLIPVTFTMHAFWKETDPMQHQMQMSNFMKNLALTGGALLISYFGAGPVSFDEKRNRREVGHEQELSRVLDNNRGIRVEDTREKIKVDAFTETPHEMLLQHFWQDADDPEEVVFQFRTGSLAKAKEIIKRRAEQRRRKFHIIPLLNG
jgi:putative oxidoreductase